MDGTVKKRVTVKLKHPNPLFERWLIEWKDKAAQSESKMQHCFAKALQSLKKYPLPLETGRDCKILQGFGDKLCQMLDEKLQKHKNEAAAVYDGDEATNTIRSKTPKNDYCPLYRSGGYAILVTLYKKSLEADFKGFMSKDELVADGRHLSDASFVKPNPGTYYTAWSSMRTLLDKDLVSKKGSPAKFSLTDAGLIVAHKLYRTHLDAQSEDKEAADRIEKRLFTTGDIDCSDGRLSQSNATGSLVPIDLNKNDAEAESLLFAPFTFDVLLIVDTAETSGAKQAKQDPILLELTHLDVRFEVRHLKVGDYVWVCRDRGTAVELVLPYVVERKRMDDFGSSIKDGRYHEQKFRLKQCGVQNVVYLIESYGDNTHTGLPVASLNQAATNTLVHDGFQVKWSDGLRGTAEYLSVMTKILENKYKSKTVMSCPKLDLNKSTCDDDLVPLMTFKEFSDSGSKHKAFSVRDTFIKHLIQLKGLSVDKAFGIVERYPTPRSLKTAYDGCTESEGEKLLANVPFGKNKKKIGLVISKVLYQLYTLDEFK